MINITLPDGSVHQYESGVTPLDIAKSISEGLARNVLSAKVNDQVMELYRPITSDATVQLLTWNDEEGKHTFWHTSAHLLATALQELYPGIKFGIGPAIENGFYYDIDFGGQQISSDDFPKIEKKMQELVSAKTPITRREVSKAEALKEFTGRNENYKVELINDLEDGTISFYESGSFTDLCRGPHLVDFSPIKAVKLISLAGAYWRGDEHRPQLTRLYAISFPKKKELDEYMAMLEEAKKRDHRKIGKEMGLFMFSDMVGKGLPIWLPKGTDLRLRLQEFLSKIQKRYGYKQVMTPHIGGKQLYVTSGHWDHSSISFFEDFLLKPSLNSKISIVRQS